MTVLVDLNGVRFSNQPTYEDGIVQHKLTNLEGWYSTTYRNNFTERTNGDGAHVPGPSQRASKTMTLQAVVMAPGYRDAAEAAWEVIAGLGGEGFDLPLRYEDTDTGSVRLMTVRIDGTIDPVPFAPGKANVAIPLRAWDPKKYAEVERISDPAAAGGIQPVGAGLRYPLHGAVAAGGYSFVWLGTAGASTSGAYAAGVLGRTNLHRDPEPRNGGTWNAYIVGPTNSTVQTVTAPAFPSGRATRITFGNTAPVTAWNMSTSAKVAVTAGQTYTFSAYGMHSWSGGGVRLTVEFLNASNGSLGYFYPAGVDLPQANQVLRISNVQTAPAGAVAANIFWDTSYVNPPANEQAYVSSVLVETGSVVMDYFSGASHATAEALLDYGPQQSFSAAVAVNLGRASAYPVFYIDGGDLRGGFSITDQRDGGEVVFTGDVDDSESLILDMRTKRLISNIQNDRTDELVVNDTMEIPAGDQRTYIFTALGTSPSGTPPELRVSITDGWW